MNSEGFDFLSCQSLEPQLCFSGEDIDLMSDDVLDSVAGEISSRSFKPIMHAPFYDLNCGSKDPKIRAVSTERIIWALNAAKKLGAIQLVLHPGYRGNDADVDFKSWLSRAGKELDTIVEHAKQNGVRLAFENIFDAVPQSLCDLIALYPQDLVGVCFDLGHYNIFSNTTMKSWLDALNTRIIEVHLHDNFGSEDDHIAIGDGSIKFGPFLTWLKTRESQPKLVLEMPQKTHVIKSVSRLKQWLNQ